MQDTASRGAANHVFLDEIGAALTLGGKAVPSLFAEPGGKRNTLHAARIEQSSSESLNPFPADAVGEVMLFWSRKTDAPGRLSSVGHLSHNLAKRPARQVFESLHRFFECIYLFNH